MAKKNEESHCAGPPRMPHAERQQVERRTSPSAAVVHEAIRREGEDELRRPSSALA